MAAFKRILLKLSGESLMGNKSYGIDEARLAEYAQQIAEIVDMGVEVGIVIGGGNIFRGLSGTSKGFDRVQGDHLPRFHCGRRIRIILKPIRLKRIGDRLTG